MDTKDHATHPLTLADVIGDLQHEFLSWDGLALRSWSLGEPLTTERVTALLEALGCTFCPGFTLSPSERLAYRRAAAWLAGDPAARPWDGLYIYGATGSGKTLLTRLLLEAARRTGIKRLCWVYRRSAYHGEAAGWTIEQRPVLWEEHSAADYVRHYNASGEYLAQRDAFLHIEDLGIEPREGNFFGSRSEVIASLLSARLDQHDTRRSAPVIITSNISPADLPREYGDRVASRLLGACLPIFLSSTDHRVQTPG